MRRIDCPAGGWIALPDEWLGRHALRLDKAKEQAREKGLPETFVAWAGALALIEDWGDLPGMDGNPDAWDLGEKSWPVLAWISGQVYVDINRAMSLKKALPVPSQDGLPVA